MSIKQKTKTIPVDENRSIEVFRMKWKDARELLKLVSKNINELLAMAGSGKTPESEAAISMQAIIDNLPKLIANCEELAEFVALHSTRLRKEEFDNLDLVEASEVLAAAIELNLGDELKNCWTGIANTLGGLWKTTTKPGENAMPSSSMPDSQQSI